MSSPANFPIRRGLSLLALLLCSACTTTEVKKEETLPPAAEAAVVAPSPDAAQQELANGIASYENGNYKTAARQLQKALAMGLKMPDDQVKAHKYQAFIHCVGGRKKLCADEFKKTLDANPDFALTPAEAGHPIWGPVFRDTKKRYKPATK